MDTTIQHMPGSLVFKPEAQQTHSVALTDSQGFDLAQRAAKLLAASSLVPVEYQNNIPNCVIALNMAHRLGADPLMVMQNLVVIYGRPSWSSQFLIATVNTCGRFSALRYEFFGTPGTDDWGCRAWAIERATGEKLDGTKITIGLSKTEGWYGKKGSKWQSMPEQMLMYRAGAWWCRAYAPELSMGLHTSDEVSDFIDITPSDNIVEQDVKTGPRRKSESKTEVNDAQEKTQQKVYDQVITPASSTLPQESSSDKPSPGQQAAGASAAATGSGAEKITGGQIKYLTAKLDSFGMKEQGILDRFKVASMGDLTFDQFDTLRADFLAME